jgi:choline dehydrogenase-like flavoprotein
MIAARDRRTIAAIFATFAPPQADAERGVTTMVDALERLAPHRRAKLLLFVALLRPLMRLSPGTRERTLRGLANGPVAALRTGFQAFKRLSLFAAYAVADEHGRNPLWTRIGYPGPRTDCPVAPAPFPAQRGATGTLTADAVVIGSGAGGGVAAALLARAGLRTIVLEAGEAAEPISATQLEAEAFASLFLESGLAATDDLGVSILAGACIGGGTTVNWCTSLRLTPAVRAQWDAAAGVAIAGADLDAAYVAVEERLGVTTAVAHNRNNAAIVDGCAALGWPSTAIPRNADGCGEGCGYCTFGCAYGRKRSTAMTYLRDAVDAGAIVYAGTAADRVCVVDGRVTGVDAGELHIDAPLVIVAAGALRTPGVLARTGIRSPHLGKHLHLHPTTALVAEYAEPVDAWHGAMQTALCSRFSDLENGYGGTIEVAPGHPGLMALALPWRDRTAHATAMEGARNNALLIALTRDRGEGAVSLDDRADIRYTVAADDGRRMIETLDGAIELAFASGARRVATLHADPLELALADATPAGRATFRAAISARGVAPNRLAVFSAHQMGTARMHRDPARGVVDPSGRVHGVDGLLVADASVFPLASGVNPMLTIMALAHRAVSAYLDGR